MSASERCLRRRRKVKQTYTCDSIDSDDQLYDVGKITTNDGFQSASLSSDNGEHVITKDKPKRRVLRKTNDFQNLKPSTQLDDEDSKTYSTKAKKSKKTTYLPRICDIDEEYEILQTKMKNRKKQQQNITPATVIEDVSSTTSKSDADTSVPSENQLPFDDIENKQKTKRKNQRKRNRRCKRAQISSKICNSEKDSSVDTSGSDVASKPSDLQNSREMGKGNLDRKSTSDSDSIVYSFRNRKQAPLTESTVQNIVPEKASSEKSDDSVEYNKRGKVIQKCTVLNDGKELTIELSNKAPNTKQHNDLAQSQAETIGSDFIIKPVGDVFESTSACQNGMIDFQMKETRKSIMKKGATRSNSGVTEITAVPSKRTKNKNKLVQFQQDEPLNTLCEDLNEKNNTYELDKSKNDISVLKTVMVESNASFEDGTDQLKISINLERRLTELHNPLNVMSPNKANPSNRIFDLETIEDLNVSSVVSGEKTPLNDNVDGSFKDNFPDLDAKPSNKANLSKIRRTFELEKSVTDVIVLKLASGEHTSLNDNSNSGFKDNCLKSDDQAKTKKSRSGSNTPFSRVTRRKKVKRGPNNVNLIDDISPPESSLLSSVADDSSSGENCNKSITKHLEDTNSSVSKQGRALSQSNQNLSSFGVSSTPLPKREGTYTVLNTRSNNKQMPSTCKEPVLLTGQSSTIKSSTRTKMPNFALIHKRAFEKMEDIEQLQQRKAGRAKLLLSGAKPTVGVQSPRKIQNQKILKPLNFGTESPKYSQVSESPKQLRNTVLQNAFLNSPKLSRPTHPLPKYSTINESPKPLHNSQCKLVSPKILKSNDTVFVNSPRVLKSRVQSPKFANSPKVARSNLQSPKVKINTAFKLDQDTKENPNKFKPVLLGKKMSSYATKINIRKPAIQENHAKPKIPTVTSSGITRYGFKTANPAKIITKQQQIAAVANKNNIVRNNVDERRNAIKGVRSNRRFELLMKMRQTR